MNFHYTLRGSLHAPSGSKLNETGTGIVLPNGRTIKIWEQLELINGDNYRSLSFDQASAMGIHYDGQMAEIEEAS